MRIKFGELLIKKQYIFIAKEKCPKKRKHILVFGKKKWYTNASNYKSKIGILIIHQTIKVKLVY